MPQHDYDLRITDHWSPRVTDALHAMFPAGLLDQAVAAARSTVAKAADEDEVRLLRAAARAALLSGAGDGADLDAVLRGVFYDAYAAGAHAATVQVGGAAVTLAGVADVDWSAWQPGNAPAAALTSNGGLARLLDRAGVTVKGIRGTLLDQLGNAIGDGVAAGDSVATIGRGLRGIVGSPQRALMIAHTETARAVTAGTMDSYTANGVQQWEWVLSDGACDICEEREAGGPYPVGDEAPPAHPFCRCAASPVVASVQSTGGSGGSVVDEGAAAAAFDEATTETSAAAEPVDLEGLTDDDLAARLTSTDDQAEIDRILTELDRRDQAAAAPAEPEQPAVSAAAARRQAKADALEQERSERLQAALDAGEDPIEAYAEIWGKDPERVRISAAMADLRARGYTGRNYEELCQSQFKEWAEQQHWKAEAETRGAMLNAEGRKKGVNPMSLFTGQDARARKYASEELLGFWQKYGRLTVADFKAANLGQKGLASSRAYYL